MARRARSADLERHVLLTYAYSPNAEPVAVRPIAMAANTRSRRAGALHSNSGDINVAATAAGLGISMEPDFMVGPLLADGRLVAFCPGSRGPHGDIWAVYPSRRHLSAKVRLFVDHVARHFAAAAVIAAL